MMKTSKEGIELIKQLEGFRSKAYKCSAGTWTIGYGFTKGVRPTDTITKQQAEARLLIELEEYENSITKYVKVALTQCRFDALVSLTFNIGIGGFKSSTLLKKLNAGRYDEVPEQILRWNKVAGKPNIGLTRRRQIEADLFMREVPDVPMPQAVDAPDKPLAQSRTMANLSVAGVVGSSLAIAPVIEPAGQVVKIVQDNPNGFMILVGVALLVFVAIGVYIKLSERRA